MEKLNLLNDIVVFGMQVTTFPLGIGECFDRLAKKIPHGFNRPYYGISRMENNGDIIYYAVAAESFPGESAMYDYTIMEIEKGTYLAITVKDWRSKTHTIIEVFHTLMQDEHTDNTKPCIEWYRSDDEMLCMIKTLEE